MRVIGLSFEEDVRFFFNTNANVGIASPNKLSDVQLVQLGYFAIAQNRLPEMAPELIVASSAVEPGAPYSGSPNDPLSIAIKVDQKVRGGVQDGHISTIRGEIGLYDGVHSYQLVRLVNQIRIMVGSVWPRIDSHPKCPAALSASVRRIFAAD